MYLPTNPADGFVNEDKYEIGCRSVPGAYISYHSVMYRKTGFILSLFKEQLGLGGGFFLTCERKAGGGVRYLTDKWESETYVPRWKLYVPRYILSLTEDCPYPG